MEQQALVNTVFGLISFLAMIIVGIVAYWAKRADAKSDQMAKELNDFKLEASNKYIHRDEHDRAMERFEKAFDKFMNKLEEIQKDVNHISKNQTSIKALEEIIAHVKGTGNQ